MQSQAAAPAEAAPGRAHELRLPGGGALRLGPDRRALVMGILNVTPDSFSDGGMFLDAGKAVARAEEMIDEGADLLDIGGESTRPGSDSVPAAEQIRRVAKVIEAVARRSRIPISIDTTRADVAAHALDAGAQIINDVSALRDDPEMAALVAARGAPVILMHMLGRPRTMQECPEYGDVVQDVAAFLEERLEWAVAAGIAREQIVLDPGFGFGKTLAHNLLLLRELRVLRDLGRPILIGTSRKAMFGQILGAGPGERLLGTAATVAWAAAQGAEMVRVHDVKAAVDVVKVIAAIQGREASQ
jgi:dihydropteroate synthase